MSDKKQTAVDWLIEQIAEKPDNNVEFYTCNGKDITNEVQQAKEMEREQIKSAYVAGREDWHLDKYFSKHSEDYYNQTYNH